MHTIVLQDWTTIQGSAGYNVIQSEEQWADLAGYKDVGIYVEVSSASGSPTIYLETNPVRDEGWFKTMTGAVFSPTTTMGLMTPVFVLLGAASQPLTRYVRWRAFGSTGAWSAASRIVLIANPVG